MGHAHKDQLVLAKKFANAKTKVTIGAKYRHYKSPDMVYELIGLGFLEVNEELHVIYRAEYGEKLTFIRPLSEWLGQVEWQGKTVPHFKKI